MAVRHSSQGGCSPPTPGSHFKRAREHLRKVKTPLDSTVTTALFKVKALLDSTVTNCIKVKSVQIADFLPSAGPLLTSHRKTVLRDRDIGSQTFFASRINLNKRRTVGSKLSVSLKLNRFMLYIPTCGTLRSCFARYDFTHCGLFIQLEP